MVEYSTEFKVKAVKEYLETNISFKYLSDKYNKPNTCVIKRWINAYKFQDRKGIKSEKRTGIKSKKSGII